MEMEARSLDYRIAARLRALRAERGWSLDELAAQSGVSRATLSRLENGETGPTTLVLARIAAAYGLTLTRIVHEAEEALTPLIRRADQAQYEDDELGFQRRAVSPPSAGLRAEVLECRIAPGRTITYDMPPRRGIEHHLLLLEGRLEMEVDGAEYSLGPGDCLRFLLSGGSRFRTPPGEGAHYVLFLV